MGGREGWGGGEGGGCPVNVKRLRTKFANTSKHITVKRYYTCLVPMWCFLVFFGAGGINTEASRRRVHTEVEAIVIKDTHGICSEISSRIFQGIFSSPASATDSKRNLGNRC